MADKSNTENQKSDSWQTGKSGGNPNTDELKQKAKQDAEELKAKAREEGSRAKEQAGASVKSKMEEGSRKSASFVDEAAETTEDVAAVLEEHDMKGFADYVHQLGGQMSDLANRLSEQSADDLTRQAHTLARNNPAAFLLGSVAIGFGLSRFAKATPPGDDSARESASNDASRSTYGGARSGSSPDPARADGPGGYVQPPSTARPGDYNTLSERSRS